jgi:hypothetical protein
MPVRGAQVTQEKSFESCTDINNNVSQAKKKHLIFPYMYTMLGVGKKQISPKGTSNESFETTGI